MDGKRGPREAEVDNKQPCKCSPNGGPVSGHTLGRALSQARLSFETGTYRRNLDSPELYFEL